jgi:hypothetical protein
VSESTDEMRDVFLATQTFELNRGASGAHAVRRALTAVLAIVERDRAAVKVTEAAEHAFDRAAAAAQSMPRHEGYSTHDGLCAALRALGFRVTP